jgi:predicted Zn-dependent peptidase
MSVEDLRDFHGRHYRPDNATLIVVGAVDAATASAQLERAFGRWTGGGEPAGGGPSASEPASGRSSPGEPASAGSSASDPASRERSGGESSGGGPAGDEAASREPGGGTPAGDLLSPIDIPSLEGRTVWLVDRPESPQSVVRIGHLGAGRTAGDYYALEVLNTVLGGSFTSRLNQNLREDKGYSYGARSTFDYGLWTGPFYATAAVHTEVTGPALTEFMNELRAIGAGISDEEIDRARNFLASRFAGGFEAIGGIAGRLSDLVLYELPLDYYDEYVERIRAVTSEDVARAAARYIDPDNLAIVVVGDRARIEEQVRELELGPVEILEVEDVLDPVPVLMQ